MAEHHAARTIETSGEQSGAGPESHLGPGSDALPLDLAEAVRRHGEALEGRALWLTRSESDADDLVQETIEHALAGPRRQIPATQVRAWLCAIMHNAFLDERRSRTTRRTVPLDAALEARLPAHEPEPQPAWSTLAEGILSRSIQRLPQGMQAIVKMHLEGDTYAQIAARLDLPMGTVATRLMRARRRLRDLLLLDQAA
jgi:RNA polymerase sigma-70 factor (ECF subfamily)